MLQMMSAQTEGLFLLPLRDSWKNMNLLLYYISYY